MPIETTHAGYTISDDPARLDFTAIHAYLSRSYWAANRSREIVPPPSQIPSASVSTHR